MTIETIVRRKIELVFRIDRNEPNIPDLPAGTARENWFRPSYISVVLYQDVTGEISMENRGMYVSGPRRKVDGTLGYNDHSTSYGGQGKQIPLWIIQVIVADKSIPSDIRLFFIRSQP